MAVQLLHSVGIACLHSATATAESSDASVCVLESLEVRCEGTPHQMRYAFSDLLRHAQVDKVTRKAMIGHVTDEMQEHYSTVNLDEKRDAMNAVAEKLKEVRLTVLPGGRGYGRGYRAKNGEAA